MTRLEAYRAGLYRCSVPPVCTTLWDEAAWIAWIDRCLGWTVPIREGRTFSLTIEEG